MIRHFIPIAALVLLSLPSSAQSVLQRKLLNDTMPNVVPNPGFEEIKRTQCAWTQQARKFNEEVMIDWTSPTETTPDLFSLKAPPECWGNPGKRTDGKAAPHSGDNMVGIKVWGRGNTPSYWHEYVEVELPQPLEAGKRYVAEVWTMRGSFSNEASNNIGMYFSALPVSTRDNLPLYYTPQVNELEVFVRGWHKVRGVFEAKGDERFLLIGNFYSDGMTGHERQPEGERGAYYFLDDVNVRLAPPGTDLTPAPKESVPPPPRQRPVDHASSKLVDIQQVEPEVGKSIRLDNIFFEFDKAELKKESEEELDKLVDLLTDYPHLHIEIQGHTDDQGTDDYNLKLSSARAQAVVDYLISKKVDTERLSAKGFGESMPLVKGITEEARAQNRRVEFKVLER